MIKISAMRDQNNKPWGIKVEDTDQNSNRLIKNKIGYAKSNVSRSMNQSSHYYYQHIFTSQMNIE